MIVVGSRGLGAFGSVLLGSVSRALVEQSDRPVGVGAGPRARGARPRAPPGGGGAGRGCVQSVGYDGGYGNLIVIAHGHGVPAGAHH
jgi:hypothetical protein